MMMSGLSVGRRVCIAFLDAVDITSFVSFDSNPCGCLLTRSVKIVSVIHSKSIIMDDISVYSMI